MHQPHERCPLALAELRDVTRDHGNPHNALSFGINTLLRGVQSHEQITTDERDELGAVLDEISHHSECLLIGDIDRHRLDAGFAALIDLAFLWADPPDRRRGTDQIADAYANARILQNWAHSVCLAREIHARGERRQQAFADRYLKRPGGAGL